MHSLQEYSEYTYSPRRGTPPLILTGAKVIPRQRLYTWEMVSIIPVYLSTVPGNVHTSGFQEWNESFKFHIQISKNFKNHWVQRSFQFCRVYKYNPRIDKFGTERCNLSFFILNCAPQFAFISQYHSSNTMVAAESRMRAWTLAVISVALCATGLATASATNVALSDEKIQLSKTGNLHYESLSDDEKLLMFKQYVTDCQRVVRDSNDKLVHVTTDLRPTCLTPYITFYIRTVHVRNRREGKIRCI